MILYTVKGERECYSRHPHFATLCCHSPCGWASRRLAGNLASTYFLHFRFPLLLVFRRFASRTQQQVCPLFPLSRINDTAFGWTRFVAVLSPPSFRATTSSIKAFLESKCISETRRPSHQRALSRRGGPHASSCLDSRWRCRCRTVRCKICMRWCYVVPCRSSLC